jgi:hypothetical protein
MTGMDSIVNVYLILFLITGNAAMIYIVFCVLQGQRRRARGGLSQERVSEEEYDEERINELTTIV